MPNPRAFLSAFGLRKLVQVGDGCVVTKINIRHVVVVPYRKYTFPLVVHVTTSLNSEETVLTHFKDYVDGHRVVNSQYGNPYDCHIENFSIEKSPSPTQQKIGQPQVKDFIITCMGYGDRIFPQKVVATRK
jgi:hypothetical protein